MDKPKLIVHESYKSKWQPEEVFAVVFLPTAVGFTETSKYTILKQANSLRIHFVPRRE